MRGRVRPTNRASSLRRSDRHLRYSGCSNVRRRSSDRSSSVKLSIPKNEGWAPAMNGAKAAAATSAIRSSISMSSWGWSGPRRWRIS